MNRREFLDAVAVAAAASSIPAVVRAKSAWQTDWSAFRDLFPLDPERVHMACFFLTSHPAPVANAIAAHRAGLDENPVQYLQENGAQLDSAVRQAAADYLACEPGDIALTDSTSMGLGLIYTSLKLSEKDEILTTTHDHFATESSLDFCVDRTGCSLKRISLYEDVSATSRDEILASLKAAISEKTRVLALTWVHSGTGLKLPASDIAELVKEVNQTREETRQLLFCLDGVHGFGVDEMTVSELGCDFFIAGTHKWIFGPRGTGLVWGRPEAWAMTRPTIGSWYPPIWQTRVGWQEEEAFPPGRVMTPGGFHSFEHRWSLGEAFRLHLDLGKARVQERIRTLNQSLKEQLIRIPKVRLHTPIGSDLSAGINCFEVDGMAPSEVAKRLMSKGVIGSTTPYREVYARLSPSLLNSEDDVERSLSALREIV